jgi:hypothetical protein
MNICVKLNIWTSNSASSQSPKPLVAIVKKHKSNNKNFKKMEIKNMGNPEIIMGSNNFVLQGVTGDTQINIHYDFKDDLGNIASTLRETVMNMVALSNAIIEQNSNTQTTILENYKSYLLEISNIETEFRKNELNDKIEVKKRLELVENNVNLEIANLNILFARKVYNSLNNKKYAQSIVQKIGHKDFKEDATTHLEGISDILQKYLDYENLRKEDFKILSNEGVQASLLIDRVEKHRVEIEKLYENDKVKQKSTGKIVTWTISIILVLIVFVLSLSYWFVPNIKDINNFFIPILQIPITVVVWGFIGSFASMIYRFNRRPTYDFGDTIKWLITRPIQGVILSSALYLVLISSQFLFTGKAVTENIGIVNSNGLILLLSFLLGFSDKFNDSVFETLVKKYSNIALVEKPKENNE